MRHQPNIYSTYLTKSDICLFVELQFRDLRKSLDQIISSCLLSFMHNYHNNSLNQKDPPTLTSKQSFSTCLMLRSFNTVPPVVVTSNHKIILLPLHNRKFAAVMSCYINICFLIILGGLCKNVI